MVLIIGRGIWWGVQGGTLLSGRLGLGVSSKQDTASRAPPGFSVETGRSGPLGSDLSRIVRFRLPTPHPPDTVGWPVHSLDVLGSRTRQEGTDN